MVKDKTGGERQSRLRLARSKWLKEHGFNSAEGLLGALMRGEVVLQVASVPTKRAGGQAFGRPQFGWCCALCCLWHGLGC